MSDMTAFERQLSGEIADLMGPVRPVDDAAIFTAITATQSPKWRFQSMFSATKFVVAGAIVALFGGFLLTGVLTQPSDESVPAVGASASATAQAAPTAEATAESEPVPEATAVPPSGSASQPGVFTPAGSLDRGREGHTATLLSDGRVLVVGGADYSERTDYVTSAEAWDPATESFSPAGSLAEGRGAHTATLLADGRVLVVGGSDNAMGFTTGLASAEIWDPATDSFSPASPLLQSRGRHTATLLPDGRVLVVGGVVVEDDDDRFLGSAEIWDPATGSFSPTGSLEAARVVHTATLLPDGRVLVVGGVNPDGAAPASAEVWDPATESFSAAGSLRQPRGGHEATLLPDGRVLVVGGGGVDDTAPAEIWDPRTESFAMAEALVDVGDGSDAVLLPGRLVLIVRGVGPGSPFTEMALWDPLTDLLVPAASPIEERRGYSLTALSDGRALLVGGSGVSGVTPSAEVWQPSRSQPEADGVVTTTPDVLPGVDLVTEEVEPGVYRVLSDGVRDLAAIGPHGMSVGQDRSVWLWTEAPGRRIDSGYQAGGAAILLELGASGETRFDPTGEFDKGFTAVAADGTFWGPDLASFDGWTWTSHPWPDGTSPGYITMEATADGAIVVARSAGVGQAPQVARIADGEWSLLPADGDVPVDAVPIVYMATAPDGSVWLGCSTYHAASSRTPACAGLLRHDGEVWETVTPVPERPDLHAGPVAVGPDGTLWVYLIAKTDPKGHYLARLADGTWSVYGASDGVPELEGLQTWESDLTVDEDGTLWIGGSQRSSSMGEPLPPPLGPSDPPHGVLSFDGTTWQQYLKGLSVERVEALDGIVWAADLVSWGGGSGGLYVITP